MSQISIIEREMTDAEFAQMNRGFAEHAAQSGNPHESQQRFGFVAHEDDRFVGCSSCLAQKTEHGFSKWCFLTDLFVEGPYRKHGLGADLLRRLEDRMRAIDVKYMYTWTAGYEAPGFYRRQGYEVFAELGDWYHSGHSRVGFHKKL